MSDIDDLVVENCEALGITVEQAGKKNEEKPYPQPIRNYVNNYHYGDGYGDDLVSGMSLSDFNNRLKLVIESIPESEIETAIVQFGGFYADERMEIVTRRLETDKEMIERWNFERQKVTNWNNNI